MHTAVEEIAMIRQPRQGGNDPISMHLDLWPRPSLSRWHRRHTLGKSPRCTRNPGSRAFFEPSRPIPHPILRSPLGCLREPAGNTRPLLRRALLLLLFSCTSSGSAWRQRRARLVARKSCGWGVCRSDFASSYPPPPHSTLFDILGYGTSGITHAVSADRLYSSRDEPEIANLEPGAPTPNTQHTHTPSPPSAPLHLLRLLATLSPPSINEKLRSERPLRFPMSSSQLVKSSAGASPSASCGGMGNGKAKGVGPEGTKGRVPEVAPAFDGAIGGGETTRECLRGVRRATTVYDLNTRCRKWP